MALANSGASELGWRAVFLEMLTGTRAAIQRFPVAVLFLLAAAVQANLTLADIHLFGTTDGQPAELNVYMVVALVAGAAVSLAVALSGEARNRPSTMTEIAALVAGAGACAVVALPDRTLALEWALVLGLFALVPVAPFIGRGDGASFWMFSVRTAFAVLLGVLALVLFAGGISAILASLSQLFGLTVPDDLYGHVWLFTSLFAAPLFGLGQLPERFDEEPDVAVRGFMDQGMRALGDFVAAPLLIVYAVILHLYVAKILITGAVPEGQIGWLVMTYGFCVFGVLILVNPFFDRARAPTRAFLRLWPFMLPIPVALLFYALALRIGAFGLTPERVLLALFGSVTVLLLILQLFPRLRGDIRFIAALPAAALVLGSFGPWGAVALSIGSQSERFLAIVGSPPVEGQRHEEALGALRFLSARNALAQVVPESSTTPNGGWDYRSMANAWGLDPDLRLLDGRFMSFSRNAPMAIATAGYDVLIQNVHVFRAAQEATTVRLPSGRALDFTLEEGVLTVVTGNLQVRFPLDDVLERFGHAAPDDPLRFTLSEGDREILFVPISLHGDLRDDPRMEVLHGDLLLRARDWR